jgi:hypothetical protein
VILYQKCRALACQPTTVTEHSTLFASRIESAPVLSAKPSIPTVHFVLRIPTRLTGRCPDQKPNFTTGDGFSHVILNPKSRTETTSYNKCLDLGREELLSGHGGQKANTQSFHRSVLRLPEPLLPNLGYLLFNHAAHS